MVCFLLYNSVTGLHITGQSVLGRQVVVQSCVVSEEAPALEKHSPSPSSPVHGPASSLLPHSIPSGVLVEGSMEAEVPAHSWVQGFQLWLFLLWPVHVEKVSFYLSPSPMHSWIGQPWSDPMFANNDLNWASFIWAQEFRNHNYIKLFLNWLILNKYLRMKFHRHISNNKYKLMKPFYFIKQEMINTIAITELFYL